MKIMLAITVVLAIAPIAAQESNWERFERQCAEERAQRDKWLEHHEADAQAPKVVHRAGEAPPRETTKKTTAAGEVQPLLDSMPAFLLFLLLGLVPALMLFAASQRQPAWLMACLLYWGLWSLKFGAHNVIAVSAGYMIVMAVVVVAFYVLCYPAISFGRMVFNND